MEQTREETQEASRQHETVPREANQWDYDQTRNQARSKVEITRTYSPDWWINEFTKAFKRNKAELVSRVVTEIDKEEEHLSLTTKTEQFVPNLNQQQCNRQFQQPETFRKHEGEITIQK